jgi:hypothetical protein
MSEDDTVGRIMDKAAEADRQALFAALQAALLAMVDMQYRGVSDLGAPLARVEAALDLGAPYGSPKHLRSISGEGAP